MSDKPLILVVEDDDQIAFLIQYMLEHNGYAVTRAADGAAAKAMIEKMAPPALVTLDINLPHASGDELMILIKSTPGWERVPVVMVTAKPKDHDVTWAVKTGAKAYLAKPFRPEELLEIVGRLAKRA